MLDYVHKLTGLEEMSGMIRIITHIFNHVRIQNVSSALSGNVVALGVYSSSGNSTHLRALDEYYSVHRWRRGEIVRIQYPGDSIVHEKVVVIDARLSAESAAAMAEASVAVTDGRLRAWAERWCCAAPEVHEEWVDKYFKWKFAKGTTAIIFQIFIWSVIDDSRMLNDLLLENPTASVVVVTQSLASVALIQVDVCAIYFMIILRPAPLRPCPNFEHTLIQIDYSCSRSL